MNHYEERGIFQNVEQAKQLVVFDGMKFRGRNGLMNVTPTDIDGLVQLDYENCVMLYELKHSGGLSRGQADALTNLADAIVAGGIECVVFVAVHNTPADEPIIAKDAIVKWIYYKGVWHKMKNETPLYQMSLDFIEHIRKGIE